MSPVNTPAGKHEYSIACMPADGIGPEVIGAGVQVLKTLSEASAGAFTLTFEDFDWSSETYKRTGKYIPDGGLENLRKHDAILFGAVGAPGELIDRSASDQTEIDLFIFDYAQTFPTISRCGVSG